MDWLQWLLDALFGGDGPTRVFINTTEIADDSDGVSLYQWITGAGAIVAATFAGIGARTALKTWKRSEEEREKEAAIARRAQAARVVATTTMETDAFGKVRSKAVVHNRSDLPIYKGSVRIVDTHDGGETNEAFKTIPPGEDEPFYGKGYEPRQAARREPGLEVVIWFSDSNSVSWVRDRNGDLHEYDLNADAVAVPVVAAKRGLKFWTTKFWRG